MRLFHSLSTRTDLRQVVTNICKPSGCQVSLLARWSWGFIAWLWRWSAVEGMQDMSGTIQYRNQSLQLLCHNDWFYWVSEWDERIAWLIDSVVVFSPIVFSHSRYVFTYSSTSHFSLLNYIEYVVLPDSRLFCFSQLVSWKKIKKEKLWDVALSAGDVLRRDRLMPRLWMYNATMRRCLSALPSFRVMVRKGRWFYACWFWVWLRGL